MIRGRFEVESHQTLIHVQMRIHPFVMAFLGFWFLSWYGAVVPITFTGAIPNYMAALFVGMPILILIIFWLEYIALCDRGGSAFFRELVRSANLICAFEPGALTQVVEKVRSSLKAG